MDAYYRARGGKTTCVKYACRGMTTSLPRPDTSAYRIFVSIAPYFCERNIIYFWESLTPCYIMFRYLVYAGPRHESFPRASATHSLPQRGDVILSLATVIVDVMRQGKETIAVATIERIYEAKRKN